MKIWNMPVFRQWWEHFGEHPARSLAWFTGITGVIWVVQTSLCQRILPLDVIEAIVWGEQMQWGQMKSPPLSGWIAFFFTWSTGYADWPLYLAAQLSIGCGVYFTYKLAREFRDETTAAAAALLLYFLYYYMPHSMKFCSHYTQLAFFPAVGYFFRKALRDDRLRDWLGMSVFAVLATLGKYAALQLLAGCFVFMLCSQSARKRFVSPGPWLAGLLYFALLAPHIHWLFQHDFLPFTHIDDRLHQEGYNWFEPVAAIGTMLMPYALFAVLLFLVNLPWKRPWQLRKAEVLAAWQEPDRRDALWFSLALTLIPGAFYLFPALAGYSIILMWFSYLAPFTGITAVALFPWKIDGKVFRNLLALAWLYFIILLPVVTIDVLNKPRYRIHTDPQFVVQQAETFWKKHAGDRPIPVVFGERWLAGVVEHYTPYRPRACQEGEVCDLALYREKIRQEGALVIFNDPVDMEKYGFRKIPFETVRYQYKSQFGRSREDTLAFGFLPPEKTKQSSKQE